MATYLDSVHGTGEATATVVLNVEVHQITVANGRGDSTASVRATTSWVSHFVQGLSTSYAVVKESPVDWINRPKPAAPVAEIDFNWTPVANPYSYVIGAETIVPALEEDGVTYSTDSTYYLTEAQRPITFTAETHFFEAEPAEFEWDFGDGTTGRGEVVDHTFTVPNNYGRVTLTVIDTRGNECVTTKRIYIRSFVGDPDPPPPGTTTLYPSPTLYPSDTLYPDEPS